MAHVETEIVHDCMKRGSKMGARLFKNVRGVFYPLALKCALAQAIKKGSAIFAILNGFPVIHAGLSAPGSSDLIGWHSFIITPAMVGKRVAVFTAPEAKTQTGTAREDQINFISQVVSAGGIAGIVRSADDLENMINSYLQNIQI